jgi:hypothetical protein
VRDALKPFADAYLEMYRMVRELSDEDLALLDGKIGMFTSTNCGWQEYEAIRVIAKEVTQERQYRRAHPSEAKP